MPEEQILRTDIKKAPRRPQYYPLYIDITGRLCVIIGGGTVGTRKAEGLLKAGALVHLIATATTEELHALQTRPSPGKLELYERPYKEGDLVGAFLVFA